MRIVPFGSRPRTPQHDGNSRQANHRSDPVVEIGRFPVHEPSPEDRQNNKDPAVGGISRPKFGKLCRVGMIPYSTRIIPPSTPTHIGLDSLSHSQTRYPPPISANPAARNKMIALIITFHPFVGTTNACSTGQFSFTCRINSATFPMQQAPWGLFTSQPQRPA